MGEADYRTRAETTRLAPSPTGALHLGNARTFLLNWAMARARGWKVVLRIEDLDSPRVKAGAARAIVDTLSWLGMDWDRQDATDAIPAHCLRGEAGVADGVLVQSRDLSPYVMAMRVLAAKGLAYPCSLTRGQIEHAASAPQEGSGEVRFPPSLRPADAGAPLDFDRVQADHLSRTGEAANWRLLCPEGEVEVRDQCAGARRFDVAAIIGDFVLWTKRDQPSYQLAVVVDDHRQGVTQVVRGDDLLDSAARQLLLYRALGLSDRGAGEPTYTHLPLVLGTDGKRLAKRHGDTRVETYRQRGVPPEAIVGLVASWGGVSGVQKGERAMLGAAELASRVDLNTLPRSPIVFSLEDDRWLSTFARQSG